MNQRVPPLCPGPKALQDCPSPAGSPELRHSHHTTRSPSWPGVTPRGGKSQLPSEALTGVTGGIPHVVSGPQEQTSPAALLAQPRSRWHFPEPLRRSSLCPLFMPCPLCPAVANSVDFQVRSSSASGASVSLWGQNYPTPHTYRTLRVPLLPSLPSLVFFLKACRRFVLCPSTQLGLGLNLSE